MKKCSMCAVEKPVADYSKDKRTRDGFRGNCRDCEKTYRARTAGPLLASQRTARNRAKRDRGELRRQHNEWALQLRLDVINEYGGACACCGELNTDFLEIDHVNGDGAEHRRRDASAKNLYRWLRRNDYPDGFQLLCANCHASKTYRGACVHYTGAHLSSAELVELAF